MESVVRERKAAPYDWVHGRLQSWGDWVEKHRDHTGFVSVTLLARMLEEGQISHMPGGHVILIALMPDWAYNTHRGVLKLPENHRIAVTARYCFVLRDDGTTWGDGDRARLLGWPTDLLRSRVQYAKQLLAKWL